MTRLYFLKAKRRGAAGAAFPPVGTDPTAAPMPAAPTRYDMELNPAALAAQRAAAGSAA